MFVYELKVVVSSNVVMATLLIAQKGFEGDSLRAVSLVFTLSLFCVYL